MFKDIQMEHKIPESKFMPSSYQWQAFDRKKGINGMHFCA